MTTQHARSSGPRHHTISSPEYEARISDQGAALRSLQHRGREVIHHLDGAVPAPPFSGAVLAPWPNRVAGGRYSFADAVHQLPVNEVDRGNALHGLALWERWQTVEHVDDAVTFEHVVLPRPGYPFLVLLRALYRVGDDGLTLTVTAVNEGPTAAPVGLSAHPYLTAGDGPLDGWTLRLPCAEVVLTDDRQLPRGVADVRTAGLDFRDATAIGAAEIDHAFTAVQFDLDGRASAELVAPSGDGVRVGWDTDCRWVQVYTLHTPGVSGHRRAVAIEPMSCAPDAFNSGAGVVTLAPGASTSVTMTIAGI